jgi:hypothetical protein
MSGVPNPVTKSYPGPAAYAPLAPAVMSWNALAAPFEDSTGPAKPSEPLCAPRTRAQMPCHDGALALGSNRKTV